MSIEVYATMHYLGTYTANLYMQTSLHTTTGALFWLKRMTRRQKSSFWPNIWVMRGLIQDAHSMKILDGFYGWYPPIIYYPHQYTTNVKNVNPKFVKQANKMHTSNLHNDNIITYHTLSIGEQKYPLTIRLSNIIICP